MPRMYNFSVEREEGAGRIIAEQIMGQMSEILVEQYDSNWLHQESLGQRHLGHNTETQSAEEDNPSLLWVSLS